MFPHLLPASLTATRTPLVVAADASNIPAALALLYSRWPAEDRRHFVRDALDAAAAGTLDLQHLLICLEPPDPKPRAAALAVQRPGREAVVWSPGFASAVCPSHLGEGLLRALGERLDRAQAQYAVAFLDPTDAADRELFDSAGFPGIADLCLLRAPAGSAPAARRDSDGLVEIPWHESLATQFAETIALTQSEGLDCPEVRQLRSGADVMASHAATAPPEPALWRLYREPHSQDPVGVLLLGDHARRDELEILYLGVRPEHRRRGIARILLADARRIARVRGRRELTVAVESRNAPALELYFSERFRETRRYAIHLRLKTHAVPPAP